MHECEEQRIRQLEARVAWIERVTCQMVKLLDSIREQAQQDMELRKKSA